MKTVYIMLFLLFGLRSFSQTDSSNWDPSDPNCPCHKWEQQAQEEWRKQQEQNANNMNTDQSNNDNHGTFDFIASNDSSLSVHSAAGGNYSSKHVISSHSKWIMLQKKMRKFRRHIGNKHYGSKRRKFRVVDCFHF